MDSGPISESSSCLQLAEDAYSMYKNSEGEMEGDLQKAGGLALSEQDFVLRRKASLEIW